MEINIQRVSSSDTSITLRQGDLLYQNSEEEILNLLFERFEQGNLYVCFFFIIFIYFNYFLFIFVNF